MYTPKSSNDTVTNSPFRLALIGAGGVGKTHSVVTTFKNVHVFDLDNGLTAFKGQKISNTPFWDPAWRLANYPTVKRLEYLVLDWLKKEGSQLTSEQTLLFDSYTMLQNIIVKNAMDNASISKNTGEKDRRTAWGDVGEMHTIIHGLFTELKCNLVVTFHEQIQRNEQGDALNKIEPVLAGQFKDKYTPFYSDVFRQTATTNKISGETVWEWQVKSDSIVNCKSRMTLGAKVTKLPATFSSLTY